MMFGIQQEIGSTPVVTIFGSATNRVQPDLVWILGSVTCVEQRPSEAFPGARQAAHRVQDYLRDAGVAEFGVSRADLTRQTKIVEGVSRFAGYRSVIAFRVLLNDLDRTDQVVEVLVGAGLDQIEGISFATSGLKQERADARRKAVLAAVEKAQNYCFAASVALGRVLRIEDEDPTPRRGGHVRPATQDDTDGRALDASLIEVGGAVRMVFEIVQEPREAHDNVIG